MINVDSVSNPFISSTDNKIIARVTSCEILCATSCEILCATPQIAPGNAYLNLRPVQIRGWNL